MEEEFGDFMFAMINAARLYGINPEDALEKSNKKFIRRFSYVEKKSSRNGAQPFRYDLGGNGRVLERGKSDGKA